MKHPLGFVLPANCGRPLSCRPDNPTYVREEREKGQWQCAVCSRIVTPQLRDRTEPTDHELDYLEALAARFDFAAQGRETMDEN